MTRYVQLTLGYSPYSRPSLIMVIQEMGEITLSFMTVVRAPRMVPSSRVGTQVMANILVIAAGQLPVESPVGGAGSLPWRKDYEKSGRPGGSLSSHSFLRD